MHTYVLFSLQPQPPSCLPMYWFLTYYTTATPVYITAFTPRSTRKQGSVTFPWSQSPHKNFIRITKTTAHKIEEFRLPDPILGSGTWGSYRPTQPESSATHGTQWGPCTNAFDKHHYVEPGIWNMELDGNWEDGSS